jgi:amidase
MSGARRGGQPLVISHSELASLDGLAQAELVRTGQMTAHELLDAAIERIEQSNPAVNAVITTMYDEARQALAEPLPDGPFTGVPFLLKDGGGAGYAGVRQTAGSRYLMDYVSPTDGELTRRYKAAGLVCCGKTNLPEFGLQPTTEPEAFGATRNPWNLELSAGGSSGGAAAAVAARMVPMANASDSGGSIRVPASCCGVFGLKPTRSRISPSRRDQGVSMRVALISENSITVSVRDSAALLDATQGPLPGDPYIAPPPVRPYLDEVGADPGRLRVAFSRLSPTGVEVHPDCIAAVEDAAALLEQLGHQVRGGHAATRRGTGERAVPHDLVSRDRMGHPELGATYGQGGPQRVLRGQHVDDDRARTCRQHHR